MDFTLADTPLRLLPGRALFLPALRTLVAADLHLGKSAAFRARGLAVPEGDTARDLDALARLVAAQPCDHLVVAGDLFHSAAGLTPEIEAAVEAWLDALPCPVTLVVGNHDRKLPHLPKRLEPVERLPLGPFIVHHEPPETPDPAAPLTLCGHLHPVARIADGKRTSLRLPCFHLTPTHLVLPAFGSFTGGRIVEPDPADRLFVFPGPRVIEVPAALWR